MKVNRFSKFAWGVLIYNLVVIAWGAYVRASGSGAGCGSHWPLCNGEVIPQTGQVETLVEFTHRLMSGAAFLVVLGQLVWARRAYSKGNPVRLWAGLAMFFMVTEALVGAGLVLFEMVADNDSMARAWWMSAHLANTFLLLACLVLTAWWASGGIPERVKGKGLPWLLGLGLLGMIVLGISGAVAALGDTLFPASSLSEALQEDLSPTAHFLIRLRLLHPTIAVSVGIYLILIANFARLKAPGPSVRRIGQALIGLVVIQLMAGVINVFLLAPIWMQLVHLLLADLVWITLVLLAAATVSPQPAASPAGLTRKTAALAGGQESN